MIHILVLVVCFNTLLYTKQNQSNEDTIFVYLVKHDWHTGILFEVARVDSAYWPEITELSQYQFIDVGWGDEEFYQHPGFDPALAVRALFYPTNSALRIEGITFNIKRYIEIMDLVIKIPVTSQQYNILSRYVADSYLRDSNNKAVISKQLFNGNIKFYKAKQKYHIFNTCNTWVAEGLFAAGFEVSSAQIIFVEDLIKAAEGFGTIINYETPE